MSECDPGASGRWPASTECGEHGICILNPAWGGNLTLALVTAAEQSSSGRFETAIYVCECDANWSSSGDFISAPYQFCHINQRVLLAMWIVAFVVVLLAASLWLRVMRSYMRMLAHAEQRQADRGVATRSDSSQLPVFHSASAISRLTTILQWMWRHTTRRALLFLAVMFICIGTLSIFKIVNIGLHLDPTRAIRQSTAGNIGEAIFPTILYSASSLAFLTAMHFASLMWAAAAVPFYSRVEGQAMMTQTYRVLSLTAIANWICYLLPVASCIIWQQMEHNWPPGTYLDAFESVVALHFQWKGLAPFFALLCDLSTGRKMIRHVRAHAAAQEKMHLQQQSRIAAAMGATPKSGANRSTPNEHEENGPTAGGRITVASRYFVSDAAAIAEDEGDSLPRMEKKGSTSGVGGVAGEITSAISRTNTNTTRPTPLRPKALLKRADSTLTSFHSTNETRVSETERMRHGRRAGDMAPTITSQSSTMTSDASLPLPFPYPSRHTFSPSSHATVVPLSTLDEVPASPSSIDHLPDATDVNHAHEVTLPGATGQVGSMPQQLDRSPSTMPRTITPLPPPIRVAPPSRARANTQTSSSSAAPAERVAPMRSQAEMHADSIAAMNDFVARLVKHHRSASTLAIVWLILNTLFAWIPLLRTLVAYLMLPHVLVLLAAASSFMLTLARREEGRDSPSRARAATDTAPSLPPREEIDTGVSTPTRAKDTSHAWRATGKMNTPQASPSSHHLDDASLLAPTARWQLDGPALPGMIKVGAASGISLALVNATESIPEDPSPAAVDATTTGVPEAPTTTTVVAIELMPPPPSTSPSELS